MKEQTKIRFLELLKSGLWGTPPDEALFSDRPDWAAIFELAQTQTVVGIMADGLSNLHKKPEIPPAIKLQLISQVLQIEQYNERSNHVMRELFQFLEQKGIHPWLIKGQGVAQNYPNPNHRMAGDIDLLLTEPADFGKASDALEELCREEGEKLKNRYHSTFYYKGVPIELHAEIFNETSPKLYGKLENWLRVQGLKEPVVLERKNTKILLPPHSFDAVYIFLHFFQHLIGGGIGLRQVCDWMMFLNKNYEKISLNELAGNLEQLGQRKAWEIFASVAVDFLGCPVEKMPFYRTDNKKAAQKVLNNIFYTGNFGTRQKKRHLKPDANVYLHKAVTLINILPVYWKNLSVFPKEAAFSFFRLWKNSL